MKCLTLVLVALLAFAFTGPLQVVHAAPPNSLAAINSDSQLSSFSTAIDVTFLDNYVRSTGPVTIFAPVNATFSTLESDFPMDNEVGARRAILDYIVPGKLSLSDLHNATSVVNVVGNKLSVSANGGNITIDGAHVVGQPVETDNSVIYPIDGLLVPTEIQTQPLDASAVMRNLPAEQRFGSFVSAINTTSLSTAMGDRPVTIFAPTDQAFREMPGMTLDQLKRDPSLLSDLLSYNIARGKLSPADLNRLTSIDSLAGPALNITTQDGRLFVNGAEVLGGPFKVGNALIYNVDHVVFPVPSESMMPTQ